MKVPTDSFKTFHAQTKVFLWSFHKKTRASAILELFLADGAMAKETGVQLEFTGNPITQHQEVSSAYFAVRSIWYDLDSRLIESWGDSKKKIRERLTLSK